MWKKYGKKFTKVVHRAPKWDPKLIQIDENCYPEAISRERRERLRRFLDFYTTPVRNSYFRGVKGSKNVYQNHKKQHNCEKGGPLKQEHKKCRTNAREGGPEAPEMLPKIYFFDVFFGVRFSTLGGNLPSGKAGPP